MKILQINCVYEYGSTGKITAEIHNALLRQGIDSVVCYGRRQKTEEPHVYKTCGEFESHVEHFFANAVGPMYGGCYPATARLIRRIKQEKPDVVHLQCINGYFVNIYALVRWLKKHRIKTVLTLHAEFMYTANCGHALDCEKWKTGCGHCPRLKQETGSWFFDRTATSWRRMKKAFAGSDLTVVSVSPWLKSRAEQSPILKDFRHVVIYNGVDTGVFHPTDTAFLREKHGLTEEKIVFHATPSFSTDPEHLKGGCHVFELARRLRSENVRVIVAGPCEPGIEVPDNVIMLGQVTDQKLLAAYYALADVTVLTSKRETFSMVAAESFCCGTPVVGFLAGGPEQISIPQYSRFVPQGDLDGLERGVLDAIRAGKDGCLPELAREKYSTGKMVADYLKIYRSCLE